MWPKTSWKPLFFNTFYDSGGWFRKIYIWLSVKSTTNWDHIVFHCFPLFNFFICFLKVSVYYGILAFKLENSPYRNGFLFNPFLQLDQCVFLILVLIDWSILLLHSLVLHLTCCNAFSPLASDRSISATSLVRFPFISFRCPLRNGRCGSLQSDCV